MAERVAVLGTGIMGAPMTRNLLKAGFQVPVWNRTPAKAGVLAAEGADLAETPADADSGSVQQLGSRPISRRGSSLLDDCGHGCGLRDIDRMAGRNFLNG